LRAMGVFLSRRSIDTSRRVAKTRRPRPEGAIVVLAPGIDMAARGDGEVVRAASGYRDHGAIEGGSVYGDGRSSVAVVPGAELPTIVLAPGIDVAGPREREAEIVSRRQRGHAIAAWQPRDRHRRAAEISDVEATELPEAIVAPGAHLSIAQ